MNPIILAIIIAMSSTLILSVFFFIYLLIMHLRIKTELPETLKLEIEKDRDVYEFIKRRRFVKPENIVVDFQKVHPQDPEYERILAICKKEFKERSTGKYNTLNKIGNFYELSEEAKKFFAFENPTITQLIKYALTGGVEIKPSY